MVDRSLVHCGASAERFSPKAKCCMSRAHGSRSLIVQMMGLGFGQLHEIHDGSDPFTPAAARAQAWSVASVIQALHRCGIQIRRCWIESIRAIAEHSTVLMLITLASPPH